MPVVAMLEPGDGGTLATYCRSFPQKWGEVKTRATRIRKSTLVCDKGIRIWDVIPYQVQRQGPAARCRAPLFH